jgi:hypothetical protein
MDARAEKTLPRIRLRGGVGAAPDNSTMTWEKTLVSFRVAT